MNKLAAAIGGSVIAIALLAHFYVDQRREILAQSHTPRAKGASPEGANDNNDRNKDRGNGLRYFVPITGGKPRPLATMDPFFRVPKTRDGLPFSDDPFVAESVQEQQWLDRHGYPNAKQWAAYSTASDLVLEQAAAAGDNVADVMLAARPLSQGDTRASGKLMTAGKNGS